MVRGKIKKSLHHLQRLFLWTAGACLLPEAQQQLNN
jgi:hypothetical protein